MEWRRIRFSVRSLLQFGGMGRSELAVRNLCVNVFVGARCLNISTGWALQCLVHSAGKLQYAFKKLSWFGYGNSFRKKLLSRRLNSFCVALNLRNGLAEANTFFTLFMLMILCLGQICSNCLQRDLLWEKCLSA